MVRRIPNILSLLRILCALGLLAMPPFSAGFFALYLVGGASDMLDGPIARHLHAESRFGATLDGVADFAFVLAVLWLLVPAIDWPLWAIVWVCAIAVVKLATLAIGTAKYRAFPFLHTWANKAAGLMCFLFPLLYLPVGVEAAILPCLVASCAAIEEFIITLTHDELDLCCRCFRT